MFNPIRILLTAVVAETMALGLPDPFLVQNERLYIQSMTSALSMTLKEDQQKIYLRIPMGIKGKHKMSGTLTHLSTSLFSMCLSLSGKSGQAFQNKGVSRKQSGSLW